MLSQPFEIVIKELCEEVLQETEPTMLSNKIIDHVKKTFSVEWSTLWLTEQKNAEGDKQLKLAAASDRAKPLLRAEQGGSAVYGFGEGLTGSIAETKKTIIREAPIEVQKPPHVGKYDLSMYGSVDNAKNKCHCVLGVPLLLRSSEPMGKQIEELRVIGVIKLENKVSPSGTPDFFTQSDAQILEGYAAVIGVALEKAQMRGDSILVGQGLLEISQNLLANLGGKPDLDNIVQKTAEVISAEACALWLRHGTQLRLEAAHGYPSKKDIPPYNLEIINDEKVGLTVYVANKKTCLNLKSSEEINNHIAWKGVNDERMWGKPRGQACYSLVTIPLVDHETEDLKGVFKIENKRKTIFQLENYFTLADERLLTILGNSISLSLIISERFERLKRLEKLVSKIRVLGSLEEGLFFILTGLTHAAGLQYNRAMVFLCDETDRQRQLVCRFAIGSLKTEEWEEMAKVSAHYSKKKYEEELDDFLTSFQSKKKKFRENPMMMTWRGKGVSFDDAYQVVSHHAQKRLRTQKYLSGNLTKPDILYGLPHGDYVLIPIIQAQEFLGIIYADNRFTGNRINQFECDVLDIFSSMAAAIIQASKVPQKLKKKSEEAWRKFSQPAAHRLGTETSIIDGEVTLYCEPQLKNLQKLLSSKGAASLKDIKESLKIIKGSAGRLRQAAEDYKQLTPDPETPKKIDVSRLLKDVVKRTTKGVRYLTIDTADIQNRDTTITTYKKRLKYVFEELIINALKEHDQKQEKQMGIKIELERKGEYLQCKISDTGKGIPERIKRKLFKEPAKGRPGGTGLGIFLIGHFLDDMGGKIELSEEKLRDYGASFCITLPNHLPDKN